MRISSYSEFGKTIRNATKGQRIPLSATLEISRRCSLNCSHCYNNLPMGDKAARARELSTEEIKSLINDIVQEGCLWMLFTGGEIFARRDFLEIYDHALDQGLIVTLFTNATLVTHRIADHLAKHPPFSIEITLYGATPETYEQMTRIPGSYRRCIEGIERLLARKLPVALKSVATKTTKDEIGQMQEMAKAWGVNFKFDSMINPRIDCSSGPKSTRLSPTEVVDLDLAYQERLSEWKRFSDVVIPKVPPSPTPPSTDPGAAYQCGGGVNSFAIDPYGNLSLCVLSEHEKFSVKKGGFKQAWDHGLAAVRSRKATRVTKCTHCKIKSLCGMCPATAYLENRDPETPVDFFCRVAHLRADRMGMNVPNHGDCDYCPGGSEFENLRHSKNTSKTKHLPVLSSLNSGGCSSC